MKKNNRPDRHQKQFVITNNQTTLLPEYVDKIAIQSIKGKVKQPQIDTELSKRFAVFEFNPEQELLGQNIIACSTDSNTNYYSYQNSKEIDQFNTDLDSPSKFHKIYDYNLGVMKMIQTKFLKIEFEQSSCCIQVQAVPNTFYHIVFYQGIYNTKEPQVITNLNQVLLVDANEQYNLLYFFKNTFWGEDSKKIFFQDSDLPQNSVAYRIFNQRNLMLTLFLAHQGVPDGINVTQIALKDQYNKYFVDDAIIAGQYKPNRDSSLIFGGEAIFGKLDYPKTFQSEEQLRNPSLIIKYSEYPVMLIYHLYINDVHVETILTNNEQINKLNQKKWIWSPIYRTRQLKMSVKEFYFDGTQIIEKDEEDTVFPELSFRIWVR